MLLQSVGVPRRSLKPLAEAPRTFVAEEESQGSAVVPEVNLVLQDA